MTKSKNNKNKAKLNLTVRDEQRNKLEKQIEALTAGLQKVSALVEASKPAPQMVNNP